MTAAPQHCDHECVCKKYEANFYQQKGEPCVCKKCMDDTRSRPVQPHDINDGAHYAIDYMIVMAIRDYLIKSGVSEEQINGVENRICGNVIKQQPDALTQCDDCIYKRFAANMANAAAHDASVRDELIDHIITEIEFEGTATQEDVWRMLESIRQHQEAQR